MNYNFSLLLIFNLIIKSICIERAFRAYIPNGSVKWFDEFLRNNTKIDVWLSIRLNNFENSTKDKYSQSFHQKHKYYCEFKVSDFELVKNHKSDFENHQIKLELLIDDIKKNMNNTTKMIEFNHNKKDKRHVLLSNKFFSLEKRVVNKFASYDDISEWIIELGKKHPNLVQVIKIGRTSERRSILAIKISENIRSQESKPLFLFEGGIHAREWLSITTNIHLIDKIIKQYLDSDQGVKNILKRFELHFIPVLNPDGYEYSRMSKFNRFWRKNMRYTKIHSSEYSCYGVDLNRNFDHKWMGSSANPCSEVFSGPYAGSEPEIRALMKYIINKTPRWVSYISLHSYGALWLSPFSYSKLHIQENFEDTCHKAMIAIKKIENVHNFKYRFGVASHELYEASGCGEDWAKEIAKINHTYVIELKPEKSDEFEHSGFEYPEEKVEKVGLEMYDGFLEYIKSFLTKSVDKSIIKICKDKLEDILKENQNLDYDNESTTENERLDEDKLA